MNKKGQMAGIGMLIMAAIIIIVGAILLQGSAQNISTVVNTVSVANLSLGTASNSTTVYLTDYKNISDVVIYNGSAIVPSTNYTVTGNVVYNGGLATSILPTSAAIYNYTGYTWNISGTAQPTAYGDSGSRAMTNLIIIMMALALAVAVIVYAVKNYQE